MSLLQELHHYKLLMLEETNSTEEQLIEFLDRNSYYLSNVLYNESIFNQYVSWLKEGGKT